LSNVSSDVIAQHQELLADNGITVGSNDGDFIWNFTAGAAEKSIHGLDGDDVLVNSSGDTSIFGGDGDDLIYDIGAGNDTLYGGDGSDTLYGGQGDDTFVFRSGESGTDTILAFDSGDKIDLTDYLDGFDPLQDVIDDFVTLTSNGEDTTVTVHVDGDGGLLGESVEVAVIENATGLDITDVLQLNNVQSDTGFV